MGRGKYAWLIDSITHASSAGWYNCSFFKFSGDILLSSDVFSICVDAILPRLNDIVSNWTVATKQFHVTANAKSFCFKTMQGHTLPRKQGRS
ncbi:hypothetical protein KIN20_028006 [Parelaphostrongylus tenuis]|uniref:Uncharacterized protein n=1 Tax=Parelaphostrongylus tenuis TaxID=148309 RepID=A0AAD5R037_PARTN|nr:hypothetical protein KIN20_028006 [Parelaphostrongylus tenuis]